MFQAGVVGGPLGVDLVFDVDAGQPGALEGADGVHGVDRVAVTGPGVGDDGEIHGPDNAGGDLHLFGHGHQRLGHRKMGAGHVSAAIDGVEAQGLNKAGGHGVVGPRSHDGFTGLDSCLEIGAH